MFGCKCRRNGKIWRGSLWDPKTLDNSCERTPRNLIRMTRHTRRLWNLQARTQISWHRVWLMMEDWANWRHWVTNWIKDRNPYQIIWTQKEMYSQDSISYRMMTYCRYWGLLMLEQSNPIHLSSLIIAEKCYSLEIRWSLECNLTRGKSSLIRNPRRQMDQ